LTVLSISHWHAVAEHLYDVYTHEIIIWDAHSELAQASMPQHPQPETNAVLALPVRCATPTQTASATTTPSRNHVAVDLSERIPVANNHADAEPDALIVPVAHSDPQSYPDPVLVGKPTPHFFKYPIRNCVRFADGDDHPDSNTDRQPKCHSHPLSNPHAVVDSNDQPLYVEVTAIKQ